MIQQVFFTNFFQLILFYVTFVGWALLSLSRCKLKKCRWWMALSIILLRPWQSSLNSKHLKVYFTRVKGGVFDKVVLFFSVVNKNTHEPILWCFGMWWIYSSGTVKLRTRNWGFRMDFALNRLKVNAFSSFLGLRHRKIRTDRESKNISTAKENK
jgi:hypothetical protein